jgi:Zn-dependent metalloprotease
MKKWTECHHPICFIVPPHLTDEIAARAPTETEQDQRLFNRDVASTIRGGRLLIAERRWLDREVRLQQGAFFTQPIFPVAPVFTKNRIVYDAQNTRRLPGDQVRGESDPPSTTDPPVNEAFDGLGATFDLFAQEYGRNSIDDKGLRMDATVHFGVGFDNAFWNGRQMVFGDGDDNLAPNRRLFNRFTASLDVIGHELTHGVIEKEARLVYIGQSGALNESLADVFGSLVKQRTLNQTATAADWLIGAELFTDNVNGDAIRSLKAPGTAYDDPKLGRDPQPAHMRDFVVTAQDNGGVHINSGIPNHAFYLASSRVGGFAWETTGLVWYEALRGPLMRTFMRFQGFARLTIFTSSRIFGPNDPVTDAIREAWQEVGVL